MSESMNVAAKKIAVTAGEFTLKVGAKALASYVGLDGDFAQFSAGRVGSEAAKQIGLNSDDISDKVIFKCDFCKHYWEEMNSPKNFNEIQIKTVEELKGKKCNENLQEWDHPPKCLPSASHLLLFCLLYDSQYALC